MKIKTPVLALLFAVAVQYAAAVWYVSNIENSAKHNQQQITDLQAEIQLLESDAATADTHRLENTVDHINTQFQLQYLRDKHKELERAYSDSISQILQLDQTVQVLENRIQNLKRWDHKHVDNTWIISSEYNRKDGLWLQS